MDAVEFLKERTRMCNFYMSMCMNCPGNKVAYCATLCAKAIDLVPIVEQWSKEHPIKTRQSEFLKMWPDAEIGGDGLPNVAPCQLCLGLIHSEFPEDCESRGLCVECRRDFWLAEIKDGEA